MFTVQIITVSDRSFRGEREDRSGPALAERMKAEGFAVTGTVLVPDEEAEIVRALREAVQADAALILTTGGTGFSPRDITPEATLAVATRNAPGIAEAIRAGSMQITRRAMLSREVSVIRHKTLIVNLPGSTKAVIESLGFVIDQFDHGLKILTGRDGECGR